MSLDHKKTLHSATIVIPTYNEGKFIAACLDACIDNDFPKDKLEIFVVDGRSKDNTREVVETYAQKYSYIKLLDNPQRYTPFAFNIGIKNSTKEIIIILGAHSHYPQDYISKLVYYLNELHADNVGGRWNIVPRDNTLMGKAFALALGHPFGSGNAKYKLVKSGITEVDTVFGGCYRKEVFAKIGLFNENLLRSQDMELNNRLKASGGKIMMIPDIVVDYQCRSKLSENIKHNYKDGMWSILPFKYSSNPLRMRHLIPLFFFTGVTGGALLSFIFPFFLYAYIFLAGLYIILNLYFSLQSSLRNSEIALFPALFIAFFTRHFVYGLGSSVGLFKLIFSPSASGSSK